MVEVGKDEVTLRLGKQANRRQLQFALQSLVAVFGKYQVKYKLTGFVMYTCNLKDKKIMIDIPVSFGFVVFTGFYYV